MSKNLRNLTSHLDSSSPVGVNVSRAPRLSLVLCSGARQQSQGRLGYRQEYWFHYSALTPPTYLTNIHAAFHLLSLQDCCRRTHRAANRRNKKRRKDARVLCARMPAHTHHTWNANQDSLHPTHIESCIHRHLSSLSPLPFSLPLSHPHPSIYLFPSRFSRLY